jgi:MFS family permease
MSAGGAATEAAGAQRWTMLALLAGVQLLGMSVWFTASAVAPQLQLAWQLQPAQTSWLTGAVQLGFVAGTALAAALNLADVLDSRAYVACAALCASSANAALVLEPGFAAALGLRFATGFCLAGVYPPAMKMIATWFRAARGLAIGVLVGSLTIGKAAPYLVHAIDGQWRAVLLTSSCAAALAALLVAVGYRQGPFPFARRPFSLHLAREVWSHRATRLAIAGYLGHMWELYAMWTWLPAFLLASMASARTAGRATPSDMTTGVLAFGALAAGGLGSVWGGWAADRIGRGRVVNLAMAISGACSLLVGLAFGASPWLLIPLVWVWGFFVVADSAQFSAMVTEVAPAHAVGTALTLQTSLGFLLTLVTIEGVPSIVSIAGWPWAFALLALGPACGIAAIKRWQVHTGAA